MNGAAAVASGVASAARVGGLPNVILCPISFCTELYTVYFIVNANIICGFGEIYICVLNFAARALAGHNGTNFNFSNTKFDSPCWPPGLLGPASIEIAF